MIEPRLFSKGSRESPRHVSPSQRQYHTEGIHRSSSHPTGNKTNYTFPGHLIVCGMVLEVPPLSWVHTLYRMELLVFIKDYFAPRRDGWARYTTSVGMGSCNCLLFASLCIYKLVLTYLLIVYLILAIELQNIL